MFGIEIHTSKHGRLWPTEYWKILFDALTRGGAKNDPTVKYPVLALSLAEITEERLGRYRPKHNQAAGKQDDSSIRLVIVKRVQKGHETVIMSDALAPMTERWASISLPYFGTIGNSKYEAQSKENRAAISVTFDSLIRDGRISRCLGLSFQLSTRKRDRDVDNLADALIPVFNHYIPDLDHLCLVKEQSRPNDSEVLRLTCIAQMIKAVGIRGEM
jgi:hypothetical protein